MMDTSSERYVKVLCATFHTLASLLTRGRLDISEAPRTKRSELTAVRMINAASLPARHRNITILTDIDELCKCGRTRVDMKTPVENYSHRMSHHESCHGFER
jgi:hypothetical protein